MIELITEQREYVSTDYTLIGCQVKRIPCKKTAGSTQRMQICSGMNRVMISRSPMSKNNNR